MNLQYAFLLLLIYTGIGNGKKVHGRLHYASVDVF